jgi:hypothetical protein
MPETKRWTVDLDIDELHEERRTHAVATLHHDGGSLEGAGEAHRHPRDADLARVGDELAAARALVELADKLQADAQRTLETYERRAAA